MLKKQEGQPGRPPACGTERGMEPDDLLCSRNARPQKALVGRAQWKINQPPFHKERTSELGGSIAVPLSDDVSWRAYAASLYKYFVLQLK